MATVDYGWPATDFDSYDYLFPMLANVQRVDWLYNQGYAHTHGGNDFAVYMDLRSNGVWVRATTRFAASNPYTQSFNWTGDLSNVDGLRLGCDQAQGQTWHGVSDTFRITHGLRVTRRSRRALGQLGQSIRGRTGRSFR